MGGWDKGLSLDRNVGMQDFACKEAKPMAPSKVLERGEGWQGNGWRT